MAIPASWSDPAVVSAMTAAAAASTDFKAAVCIFFAGGNDHHNTVIPLTGTRRTIYDTYRATIGIATNAAPVNDLGTDWRLHPVLTAFKTLWDANKLAVIHGIGTLVEPTTKAQYTANTVSKPPQLFSHNDQVSYWHSLPQAGFIPLEGWLGRAIDFMDPYFNPAKIAPSGLSISGGPVLLNGYESIPSTLTGAGATQLVTYATLNTTMVSSGAIQRARERNPYGNKRQAAMAAKNTAGVQSQNLLNSTLAALPSAVEARFTTHPTWTTNGFLQQMRTVARGIYSGAAFGHRRQCYYTAFGTYDTHANQLIDHASRHTNINAGVEVLWLALNDLGLQDKVALFTHSDFGRTLVQNGAGTDHAWSATHFIAGGAVTGGHYGTPPDYTINGPDDTGAGRFIPKHPVEQMAGTILKWMGIPENQLHLVMANMPNFTNRTFTGLLP